MNEYWKNDPEQIIQALKTNRNGLETNEALQRLKQYGPNTLQPKSGHVSLKLFINQFRSPIVLILIAASLLSFYLDDSTDALIILCIVFSSASLSFWQEHSASDAMGKLMNMIRMKCRVRRDGTDIDLAVEDVVPGDVVLLSAGSCVPADCFLLEEKDLFVNESVLTGETFPVEKKSGTIPTNAEVSKRTNCLFLGTHVTSGTASAVVVETGRRTEVGKISEHLKLKRPETEFERGVRQFGFTLMEITILLVMFIFAANIFLKRPVLESFLFSLGLAVGLTPQLLPAIISINLSHGARKMAERKVIVKRLQSIENFGSMDVLCCDKTGTVTEGQIVLEGSVDADGGDSQKVLLFGHLNSLFQNGFSNPMDDAIRAHPFSDHSFYSKLDEVPYDFTRRRITVLVRDQRNQKNIVITKGAFENVLDCCNRVELPDGWTEPRSAAENRVRGIWKILGNRGFRSLGVAYKETTADHISKCDETGMTFLGILTFYDPPRQGIVKTLARLRKMGTALKIISGDNRLIASYVAQQIGLKTDHILTGSEICNISDQALAAITSQAEVFAEIQPNQKEKIIFALKKTGHVVGYMGDGINDATALHAADVGISVNNAVDVAKEAADILLMDKDLSVLADGIREGRKTFANTLKYVFMASSANFGNMFSMAGASLLLPFLPLLPKQILLTNLLTDFPEMTVASDNVDREMITQPKRWDVSAIRRFMLYFGLTSSFFDFLTFTILLLLFHADASQFRAGWFIESVTSAALVVLVIRSRRVFWKSSPSVLLLTATTLVCAAAIAMPYVPIIANMFGFKPIPLYFIPIVVAIIAAYATVTELVKGFYYKKAVTQQQPVMSSAMVPQDAH